MHKLERLEHITRTFGPEFVVPYRACRTWPEIEAAIKWFETNGEPKWGMRTDTLGGQIQGFGCPFVYPGTLDGALAVWNEHHDRLVYIVCGAVQPVICHGVGILIDDEHVFFEINDKEPHITQRNMYDRPGNLKSLVLGHAGHVNWNGGFLRSFDPEDAQNIRLDSIWRTMVLNKVSEATFSIRQTGKIVIW
jgi:hypothetical protein